MSKIKQLLENEQLLEGDDVVEFLSWLVVVRLAPYSDKQYGKGEIRQFLEEKANAKGISQSNSIRCGHP